MKNTADLPVSLYLGLPIAVLFGVYTLAALGHSSWLRTEMGLVETLTNIFLVVAIFYFVLAARAPLPPETHTRKWLIFLLIGTIYFAGEEMSWGQFMIGWETPQAWSEMNDQRETNIHNTWSLFDQLPRAALTFAALIGGILIPLYRWLRKMETPPVTQGLLGWLPSAVCIPVCVIAVCVSPLDDYIVNSHYVLLQRIGEISGGELKECMLAMFIMIYALSAKRRITAAEA